MVRFELVDEPEGWHEPSSNYADEDPEWNYPDHCEECGGRQKALGGQGHYNGSYQCYTLELECENCGVYDVECV